MEESIRLLRLAWELEQQALDLRERALSNLPEPLQARLRRIDDIGNPRSDVLADLIERVRGSSGS